MGVASRLAVAGLVAAALISAAAASSWACVPGGGSGPKLTTEPAEVRPGEQVTVSAPAAAGRGPIEVRLNSPTGPVLAVLVSTVDGASSGLRATFAVPGDLPPGRHALLATQAGVDWDPVLLGVIGPDGKVPDRSLSDTAARAYRQGNGSASPVGLIAAVGAAVAVTAGIVMLARRGSGSRADRRADRLPSLPVAEPSPPPRS